MAPRKQNVDPKQVSLRAGLTYVSDTAPGIRRVHRSGGFAFVSPKGRLIRDPQVLRRVRNLVIPPAWRDVWICPTDTGHIQAVGRDARGRKQYRYHPRWQQVRQETKFHRMLTFGRLLPRIRRRIDADLRMPGLPREKVLAAVIRLMERTHVRVGNDEYASQNNSFGLTTLQDRHAKVAGAKIAFKFRGKSGKEHEIELADPRLAKIVRACQELPGQELLQYRDEAGEVRDVTSGDVSDYLRKNTGEDFTAKDFRTWAGTVLFVDALRTLDPCTSRTDAKRKLVGLVRDVAARLGNTATVCRKYYIHPAAIDSFLDNSIHAWIDKLCGLGARARSMPTEKLVLRLLEKVSRSSRATPRRRSA